MKKKIFKNYILSLISILVSLLIVEIFLKIDNRDFYEPKFVSKKIGNQIFTLNSVGEIRSKENQILMLGDSFMMGKKCGTSNNLPGLLSKDFVDSHEVINFGQPGVNSMKMFSNLKLYLENSKKPSKVIVGFYSNDIHLDKNYCEYLEDLKNLDFVSEKEFKYLKKFCSKKNYADKITKPDWHKFGITQLVNEAVVKIITLLNIEKLNTRNKFYSDLNDLNSLENKLFRYSIFKIKNILEIYNIDNLIFFFPNAENLNLNSDISNSYNKISDLLFEEFNFEVINGYKFFNIKKNTSMTASLLDKHSNCEYYQIIYQNIKKII